MSKAPKSKKDVEKTESAKTEAAKTEAASETAAAETNNAQTQAEPAEGAADAKKILKKKSATAADETAAPKTTVQEAIEIALASAGTAVDASQEMQRLRADVQKLITGSRKSNMILFYATLLFILAGCGGIYGSLVFYQRSINDLNSVSKYNRDALQVFGDQITKLLEQGKGVSEALHASEHSVEEAKGAIEENSKLTKALASTQSALNAKLSAPSESEKVLAQVKQTVDELTAANRVIAQRLSDLASKPAPVAQAAPVAPKPAAPPAPKPKTSAEKPAPAKPKEAKVWTPPNNMIRYP
jgi:archaellum component FlaC